MLEQVLQQQQSIRQMLQKQMELISSLSCGSEKPSSVEKIVPEDVIEVPFANKWQLEEFDNNMAQDPELKKRMVTILIILREPSFLGNLCRICHPIVSGLWVTVHSCTDLYSDKDCFGSKNEQTILGMSTLQS